MASVSGKHGKIEYASGKVVNVTAWNCDIDTNLIENTAWSTSTDQWRSYVAGLSGAAGSLTANFDQASTGQKNIWTNILTPTTGLLILYVDRRGAGGANIRGSALFERMGLDVDIDGKADATYDFRYTGTVAYSTST